MPTLEEPRDDRILTVMRKPKKPEREQIEDSNINPGQEKPPDTAVEDAMNPLTAVLDELNKFRTEINERFNRLDARLDNVVEQLAVIMQKLDEGK